MTNLGMISNVLKRNVGDRIYYIGTLSSDVAKELTFVPVVEDSDTYLQQILKDGYQRPGKKTRMNQFKKYLKEYSNRLIPPVILSARGKWKFSPHTDSLIGDIQIEGRAAIVDGQHRVGGIVSHFQDTNEPLSFDFISVLSLVLRVARGYLKKKNIQVSPCVTPQKRDPAHTQIPSVKVTQRIHHT